MKVAGCRSVFFYSENMLIGHLFERYVSPLTVKLLIRLDSLRRFLSNLKGGGFYQTIPKEIVSPLNFFLTLNFKQTMV